MPGGRSRDAGRPPEQGIALFYAILLTAVVTLLAVTAATYSISAIKAGQYELARSIQAKHVVLAGLQAAQSWFSRQPVQPVRQPEDRARQLWPDMAFYPRYAADPAQRDTDDEAIGLVGDIPITQDQRVWGHYVVARQSSNNDAAAGGDPANNNPNAVHDISHQRTTLPPGSGTVWQVPCLASVYLRNDLTRNADGVFTLPYDQPPNKVMSTTRAAVELLRMTLNLPAAAILTDRGRLSLDQNSRVKNANGTAILYGGLALPPRGVNRRNVQGAPQTSLDPTLNLDALGIFGSDAWGLNRLADQVVAQAADLAQPMPAMAFIVINGDAVFSQSQPLTGGGILFVTGSLTLGAGGANYSGVVYAGNGLTMAAGSYLNGTALVRGNATLNGAVVAYNSDIVQLVRSRLGGYRETNLSFKGPEGS